MVVGLLLTRVFKLINIPNVTAYLIAGLILGPYVLNVFTKDVVEVVTLITSIALGFIAFSIGAEFKLSTIKQIGSNAITITMWQGLVAVALVIITLIIAGYDLPVALTLGAIAAATAPAATLMVVRQYKANGPVTRTLLPVVAMDDALGLAIFSICIAVSKTLASGEEISVYNMLVVPLIEIVGSLGAGFALGLIMTIIMRFFKSRANKMCMIIAFVFVGCAISEMFGLSSLLVCMMLGAAFINLKKDAEPVLERTDFWTPPLFLLFFVISGAELDVSVLPTVGLLGVLYLLARSIGKYLGSYIGSAIVKADPNIKKYLGVTLLPQAGVAIGMAQMAISELPEYGQTIKTVVLCATLIYELVGPVLTRIALQKAGEIKGKPKKLKEKNAA